MKNPVEKKFNDLVIKWTKAINKDNVKIVRIHADHDEENFILDFFDYMLALDTEQEDLVFLLESPWSNLNDFSKDLLEELQEIIDIWNTATKPVGFPQDKIEWKTDYQNIDEKNKAALFVTNINRLVNELVPDKDTIVSFVLKIPYPNPNETNRWLTQALDKGLEEHIRLGIFDLSSNVIYSKLERNQPENVHTLYPNIDMDGCMEEMAQMGDPSQPETLYRSHLVKLMNAVKNRNDKEVKSHAKKCLDIAVKNIKLNANWINQVIFIYTLLYNHQIGHKNYKKALFFGDKAVEAGSLTIGRIESATAYRLYGQTLLGRGTIIFLMKDYEKSSKDYELAITCYKGCNDHIMQCESTRMYVDSSKKSGDSRVNILEKMIDVFNLVDVMTSENIKNSTFPWVMKELFYWKNRENYLSDAKMKEKLIPHFGEDYMGQIERYGSVSYSQETFFES